LTPRAGSADPSPASPSRRRIRLPAEGVFFALSLFVALAVGLSGLDRFPIFFLGDEAVESVRAASTLRDHFRDEFDDLLPAFFKNEQTFNLGITTYVHMIPYEAFGHSIAATRGTEVVFAVAALAAVGLLLREGFGLEFWWIGVLAIATIPGWFLHTRMAFGIPIAIGFFAWFVFFYVRYRKGRPLSIFPAILFAALTFYSYMGMQPVLGALAVLLLVVDAPWHWRQRRLLPAAAAFALVLAFPMVRFLRAHPEDLQARLSNYDSYWVKPWPLQRKAAAFATGYADALAPSYWLDRESLRDLERHRMKGYGHVLFLSLPFAAIGLYLCAARIREPGPRVLLAVLVAAPVGAALVGPGITREFALVLAFGALLAVGLDALLSRAARRVPRAAVAAAAFLFLSGGSVAMLADSLTHGPRWYSDYGLYGMQWGARQVFGEIRRDLGKSPGTRYYVSHDWANAVEQLVLFFFPDDPRVAVRHLDHYRDRWGELDPRAIHVLIPEEYARVRSDPRFVLVATEKVIPYPDGRPGFYFVRLDNPPDLAAHPEKYGLPVESVK
jgi:hypothetical protein